MSSSEDNNSQPNDADEEITDLSDQSQNSPGYSEDDPESEDHIEPIVINHSDAQIKMVKNKFHFEYGSVCFLNREIYHLDPFWHEETTNQMKYHQLGDSICDHCRSKDRFTICFQTQETIEVWHFDNQTKIMSRENCRSVPVPENKRAQYLKYSMITVSNDQIWLLMFRKEPDQRFLLINLETADNWEIQFFPSNNFKPRCLPDIPSEFLVTWRCQHIASQQNVMFELDIINQTIKQYEDKKAEFHYQQGMFTLFGGEKFPLFLPLNEDHFLFHPVLKHDQSQNEECMEVGHRVWLLQVKPEDQNVLFTKLQEEKDASKYRIHCKPFKKFETSVCCNQFSQSDASDNEISDNKALPNDISNNKCEPVNLYCIDIFDEFHWVDFTNVEAGIFLVYNEGCAKKRETVMTFLLGLSRPKPKAFQPSV